MERMTGIEPVSSAWKAEVLPLYHIRIKWSGRRDSNSRPSPWQGDALPLSHFRIFIGRGRWIRTTESSANGFTVRPLWPLGNPSKFCLLDYYTITFVNVQQIFFFFIGAGGGNYTNASHLPFLPSLRMAANISLLQSPPDFSLRSSPFGFDSLYWSWWRESNPQPADYKSAALPLSHTSISNIINGDPERARTVDLQRDRLAF